MIRAAVPEEADEVWDFFEAIERGLATRVLGDQELAVVPDNEGEVVVLVAPEILALPPGLLEDADHGGLRIGSIEQGSFRLDLQGAVRMAAHSRRLAVRVNEKATRLWLYGRDILGDSVLAWDHGLRRGDACIVVNPRWEAIGIGEVMGRFKGQEAAVRPIHDLGTYLRDQGDD